MWPISKRGRIDRLVVFRFIENGFRPAGELTFEGGDARIARFVYARSYLENGYRALDPIGLPLRRGSVSSAPEEVHLTFHDVGPDGWGKGILNQAFPTLRLGMAEYLALGGASRTGDLAFGPTPDGRLTWVPENEPQLAIPSDDDDLDALQEAAKAVDEGEKDGHHLRLLVRHSADIGGARPKARLKHKGKEWIAKFSTWSDKFNDPIAEAASLDVAEAAGIPVPERELVTARNGAVLMVRRFDRSEAGNPYGYLSMGTLLKQPSTAYATDKTYLDMALTARAIGVRDPEQDVFRRLLVNSYLHNTDDHLRNHALIDRGEGWVLSPAFDVVPNTGRGAHVCAPAPGVDPVCNPETAFSAHTQFRIAKGDAEAIRDQVHSAARRLWEFAEMRGMPERDRRVLRDSLTHFG